VIILCDRISPDCQYRARLAQDNWNVKKHWIERGSMGGPAQTNLVVTGPGQGEFQRDIPFNSNSDSERSTILDSRQIKQCYIGTSASCSNKFSNFIRSMREVVIIRSIGIGLWNGCHSKSQAVWAIWHPRNPLQVQNQAM